MYYLTVTDDSSCVYTDSVYINEPPCNNFLALTDVNNVACNGDSDGDVLLTIVNGNAPYSITWSSGPVDTTLVDGLAAGLYSVEVTDALNCYTFHSFGITEPSALSVGLSSTNLSCFETDDGTLDLTTFSIFI
jgi:hypothetical protein